MKEAQAMRRVGGEGGKLHCAVCFWVEGERKRASYSASLLVGV